MQEPRLIQHYIDEHVRQAHDNIAVSDGQRCITYSELEMLSNQLANCLRQSGIARQDRVVLCMKRSVHCLTAIVAILKADAIYVPLDPKTPERRWQKILSDCQPRAIICDESTLDKLNPAEFAEDGGVIVQLNQQSSSLTVQKFSSTGWLEINELVNDQPNYLNAEDDVAYVMYTSGSTGQPKGVMVTHRNVRTYIDWAVDYLGLCRQDKILSTAPLHFDMSTFDIHCTLKAGATLCIANDLMTMFPEKLVQFIEDSKATVWKGVSSLLMYLARADAIGKARMPSLKTILFAGETLPTKYLILWMAAHPDKQFINAYGPTEATGISLYHKIEKPPESSRERIPIGKPCKDTEVFLARDDMSPAKKGEVGELCIAGPCLSRGYLNDPQKTAQAFVQTQSSSAEAQERFYRTGDLALLRADGNYEFISRKDSQVKIMGYRIELGEIEHALLSIKGVDDAVVIVSEAETVGLPELVGYYESDDNLAPAAVLVELRKNLPVYMLPKRVVKIDKIPRSDRGKIVRESFFNGLGAGNG